MKGRPNFSPKALGDALHFWLSAAALKPLPVKINEGSAQKPFLKLAYHLSVQSRVAGPFLQKHISNTPSFKHLRTRSECIDLGTVAAVYAVSTGGRAIIACKHSQSMCVKRKKIILSTRSELRNRAANA